MHSDWTIKTIQECAADEPYSTQIGPFGNKIRANIYTPTGVPVLRGTQVNTDTRFFDDDYVFVSEDYADRELYKFVCEADDIILCHKGTLGKIGIIPRHSRFTHYVMGNSMMKVRCNREIVESLYLYYWLRSSSGQNYLFSRVSQVGVPQIQRPLTTLRECEISLPPIEEQRAIASILGALDDKIELNRRMNATLEAMARAIFKSWFVDFDPVKINAGQMPPGALSQDILDLFPSTFQDSGIPVGWEHKTVGDVVDILDSKRIPLSKKQRAERKGPYPYYGAASVMDYVDAFLFHGPHVLMGEDGSVVNDDGTPVLQYVWGQFWVNNHAHVLKGCNGISDEHLFLHLQHAIVKPFVTGAVQPKINQANLKRIPFLFPTREIADVFSQAMTPLFSQIRANSGESGTLAKKRDTLLPLLLAGALPVDAFAEQM